jgi:uncharacterized hydrophobic protein (TIGR00271 family)
MRIFEYIDKIIQYVKLDSELDDFTNIHETIEKDTIFKGTNLWVLVFAILVASVGLNMNSTAVIIGAMLISPLMGPINGIGYSLATYNFPLFRKALKNLLFAVSASLLASTLYFLLTPISTAHSELLARTSPTIYDVLIALFGGLAGIVAISNKKKGNAIPGVAIATALMPPLCTAGYGLATGQYSFFFGAFYLFTINAVFIAISTVLMAQILKFPFVDSIDPVKKRRVNIWVYSVISLVFIPSLYLGYQLVQKEKFKVKAESYVSSVSSFEGNYLLKHEINSEDQTIKLIYGGSNLTENQKSKIKEQVHIFDMDEVKIVFQQGFSLDELSSKTNELENLRFQMNNLNMNLEAKEKEIQNLKDKSLLGKQILSEIKSLYPDFEKCSYAETEQYNAFSESAPIQIITLESNGDKLEKEEKNKIYLWLTKRLQVDTLKLFFENK